jgi:acetolactate synthase-1/2/3 large subunit
MMYQEAAQAFSDQGTPAVFGIPGGGASLSLITALEQKAIPFYLTHFEGSAAMMAAAIGRLSSSPGVSISIKGPGLVNAMPGIAVAWFEAWPLVHIAEATPADTPIWVAHKRLDQHSLCRSITKAVGYLSRNGDGIHEAFSAASTEEPGPILLELDDGLPVRPSDGHPAVFDRSDLSEIRRKIAACRKPAVIAGYYAARNSLGDVLSELNIPVFHTVAAKGLVDETIEYSAGVFTGVDEELTPEWNVLRESDFVISIGLTPRELLSVKPFAVPSLNLASFLADGIDGFQFNWIMSIADLPEIVSTLKTKEWGRDRIARSKARVRERLTHHFLPGRIYSAIERRFGQKVRMVLDTGAFCTVGEYMINSENTGYFLASGQGRYMGTSIPMGLGAALYDRSVPTIVVTGDGGIGMYLADLKLAVQNRLPLLVILMSDGGFGCMRSRARQNGLSISSITTDGQTWENAIGGLGISGIRAESENDFDRALMNWDPGNGPVFIEVIFNPEQYEKMTEGVRA